MNAEERSQQRVAVVVQRYHRDLAGGSERHAGLYAEYLAAAGFAVDLLTTTAADATTWANEYPAGDSFEKLSPDSAAAHSDIGFRVLRFPVVAGRTEDWPALHDLLLRETTARRIETPPSSAPHAFWSQRDECRWPRALQEEWIRRQGPHSPELLAYLRESQAEYGAVLFLTYLFEPTYAGLQTVDAARSILVPTLHDEAPAYLPAYRHAARRAGGFLWNTPAERQLAENLWGPLDDESRAGRAVFQDFGSMGIDPPRPAVASAPGANYALYCGRISSAKGCADMIAWFCEYVDQQGSVLRSGGQRVEQLVLTGDLQMKLPAHPAIEYRGFVSEDEKFALMSRARLFIMPSAMESLSVVTLEAMGQGTPVLGNAGSAVVHDHIAASGAGLAFYERESFHSGLAALVRSSESMGAAGRAYVAERYGHAQVSARVVAMVERTIARSGSLSQ